MVAFAPLRPTSRRTAVPPSPPYRPYRLTA